MAMSTFSESVGQFRGVAGELMSEWREELVRWARELLSSPLMRGGEAVLPAGGHTFRCTTRCRSFNERTGRPFNFLECPRTQQT